MIRNRNTWYIFIFLIILLSASCSKQEYHERKLISDRPATMFEEAYPLGNGRIGAMVYGGVTTDRIMLNEESLWAGGPVDPHMNPEAHLHLQEVRDALFEEDYPLADQLVRQLQGSYSQSYAPLGDLYFEFEQADTIITYNRELDLRNGISNITYYTGETTITRESFVSYQDQVLAIRLSSSDRNKLSFKINAGSQLPHSIKTGTNEIIMDGLAPSHAEPNYRGNIPDALKYSYENSMRFRMTARIIETDGILQNKDSLLSLSEASYAVILVSIASSFNGFDKNPGTEGLNEKNLCREYLKQASQAGYKELRERHVDDFSGIFNRLSIDLGPGNKNKTTRERLRDFGDGSDDNDLVALYFQYGRYLLMSSSRPGGIPANLQGIWNEHLRPPWSSNYTTNINAEMNYWPAEVCNLSEMHMPLLDFIGRLAQTGKITAKTFYDCQGWCCHHNTDIWAMTNPVGDFGRGHPVWANWNMGAVWLTSHLWEHYLFTSDTSFLTDYAYPLMKGAAEFCLDFLTEAKDGYMVTAPTTSPENLYKTPEGYIGACLYGSTADMAMIRELFNNTISASHIAGDEANRLTLTEMMERLPPYKIGSKGNLQEWYFDWEDQDPRHRHISHLFGLYPGHSIKPDETPELAEACRRSLELRTNNGTGWSIAWKIALWARLYDGNMALDAIKKLLHLDENIGKKEYHGGGTFPNLLDAHPPFQIDGNFGGTAGIAEMLLQSNPDEIILLPALPDTWQNGEIIGLRARGGYTVNIKWEKGKLKEATVVPDYDKSFRVKYRDHEQEYDGRKGQSVNISP